MFKSKPSPEFLTIFLNYLIVTKGRSELTVLNYYSDLRLFLRFLMQKNGIVKSDCPFDKIDIENCPAEIVESVTLSDITQFLSYIRLERKNDSKAVTRKGVAIRQFFKYLTTYYNWFEDKSPAANLELPKAKKTLPKHLTIEQATDLLKQSSEFKSWADVRDYTMIVFFLNCGMRLSELVGINTNSYISTKDGDGTPISYLKVLGKGNKERIIYLNYACVNAYEQYLSVRPSTQPTEKALFISSRLKRISNRRVEQIIDERLRLCGLDNMGFSVHKLRHTAATLMYQNGVDVRVLKEVLGHENLDTTQIYTHVANEQIQHAMEQNPLSGEIAVIRDITKKEK